eukprot:PhM_4_TR5188/c0_g2_i1/m.99174/K03327/TC.MATE, SLC47A, norM, mdtK, dinF; multidrug resistance protein, MATE family
MANQNTLVIGEDETVIAVGVVEGTNGDNDLIVLGDSAVCQCNQINSTSFRELFSPKEMLEDAKSLVTLAVPIIISNLASTVLSILCLHYIGQLGTVELAGGALGVMFCNMSGICSIVGLASVLDTLLPQAYGADKHSRLMSVYMQRAVLVCMTFGFGAAVIWFNTEPILIFLHQDPKVAAVSGAFARTYVLYLVPAIIFEVMRKLLQVVEEMMLMSIVSVAIGLLMLGIFPLCIHTMGLGVPGAAFALFIASCMYLLSAVGIVLYKGVHRGLWHGFSRAAFKDWREYLALGLPCLLMLLLEWGSFEASGIGAGMLGVEELGVMAVSMQAAGVCFMNMLGLGIAVAVRVGGALGANDVATAKRTFMTALFVTAVALLCNVTLLYMLRHAVADFFSNDAAVHRSFIAIVPFLMLFHLFDGLQCICNSLVRGLGFQRWGLLFNCATYGIGIPIAWCLAFLTDLGVLGLWVGPTVGTFTGCVCQLTFLFCMDWQKAAREASARLDHGKVTLHDVGEPATDTEAAAAEEAEEECGSEEEELRALAAGDVSSSSV